MASTQDYEKGYSYSMHEQERKLDRLGVEKKSFIRTYPGLVYILCLCTQITLIPVIIGIYALTATSSTPTLMSNMGGVISFTLVFADLSAIAPITYIFNKLGVFNGWE